MAYQANKPQATDALSQSQIDIQNNFGAIQTLIDVNHVDFASSDAGKHKFVTFPAQTLPLVPPIVAGEIGLFNQSAAPTGINDLWMYRGTAAPFPITGANVSAISNSGWTYLPSGALIVWGISSMNAVTQTITIPFNSVPGFPGFSVGISFPFFTVRSAVGAPAFVTFGTATLTQFTAFKSTGTAAVSFGWMVIGQ